MSNFEIIPVSNADILDISTAASDELSILGSFEALEFEFDEAVDKARGWTMESLQEVVC